ncbi:hypothetical protein BC829DRAFT_485829 [Chytridium lagenaria]|nr:hypothetical protein BC829DRAFT_485829 [Chytridium lagenaria]
MAPSSTATASASSTSATAATLGGVGIPSRSLSIKKTLNTPAPIDALLADLDDMIRKQSISSSSGPTSPTSPYSPPPHSFPARDSKFDDEYKKEEFPQHQQPQPQSPQQQPQQQQQQGQEDLPSYSVGELLGSSVTASEGGQRGSDGDDVIMIGYLHKLSLSSNETHERVLSRIVINDTSDTMVSEEPGNTGRYILEVRTERERTSSSSSSSTSLSNDDDDADGGAQGGGSGPRIWRLRSEDEDTAMSWLVSVQDLIEREHQQAVDASMNMNNNNTIKTHSTVSSAPTVSSISKSVVSSSSSSSVNPPRVSSTKRNPVPLGPSSSKPLPTTQPATYMHLPNSDRRPSNAAVYVHNTQPYTPNPTPIAQPPPPPISTSYHHHHVHHFTPTIVPLSPQHPTPQHQHLAAVTASTLSPMMATPTSGRPTGAGAGAFSSRRREEKERTHAPKGMDGLMMGGGGAGVGRRRTRNGKNGLKY